jgi:hypothetical protein
MSTLCRCGSALGSTDRFCASCGNPAGASSIATMVAPAPTLVRTASVATRAMVPSPTRSLAMRAGLSYSLSRTSAFPAVRVADPEDLVIVLDRSWSMAEPLGNGQTKLEGTQNAVCQLISLRRKLSPDDRVAIVTFWDQAEILAPLTPLRTGGRSLIQAVQDINAGDGTDLDAGLTAAGDAMDWNASGVNRKIVLLTDGQGGDPIQTAEELKLRNVTIEVIGVAAGRSRQDLDEPLLQQVASTVKGVLQYAFIKDRATLLATFVNIATKVGVAAPVPQSAGT